MVDKHDKSDAQKPGRARRDAGQQTQNSRQSLGIRPGADAPQRSGAAPADRQNKSGVGSSQGQDHATGAKESAPPARRSAGTADIERGSADTQDSGPEGSMVNESTGAFKERP